MKGREWKGFSRVRVFQRGKIKFSDEPLGVLLQRPERCGCRRAGGGGGRGGGRGGGGGRWGGTTPQYLGQLSHGESGARSRWGGGHGGKPDGSETDRSQWIANHTVLALMIYWRLKTLVLQENEIQTQKPKPECKRGDNRRGGQWGSSVSSQSKLTRNICWSSVRIFLEPNTMLKFLGFITNPKLSAKFLASLATGCKVSSLNQGFRNPLLFSLFQAIP